MARDRYFDKFPTITYSNTSCIDISKRVVVRKSVLNNPYSYYPYDLTTHERPDQFANRYYDDSYKSWMLYITNNIIDPYYGWYLDDEEFNNFITQKYRSIFLAQNKTKFYRTNWTTMDPLDVNGYDALPANCKDYWQPVYGVNNRILNYARTNVDWAINTNKIISYTVSANTFVPDEQCTIVFSPTVTGNGQVLSIQDNTVYLQHITGTYLPNTSVMITGNSYIYGTESLTNTVFTTATQVANNIQPNEEIYWSPVTYYDFEREKNEQNKTIKVLDKRFAAQTVRELTTLLKS